MSEENIFAYYSAYSDPEYLKNSLSNHQFAYYEHLVNLQFSRDVFVWYHRDDPHIAKNPRRQALTECNESAKFIINNYLSRWRLIKTFSTIEEFKLWWVGEYFDILL